MSKRQEENHQSKLNGPNEEVQTKLRLTPTFNMKPSVLHVLAVFFIVFSVAAPVPYGVWAVRNVAPLH